MSALQSYHTALDQHQAQDDSRCRLIRSRICVHHVDTIETIARMGDSQERQLMFTRLAASIVDEMACTSIQAIDAIHECVAELQEVAP